MITVRKLIEKFGTSVRIKRRSESVDSDGHVTYSYDTIIEDKCLWSPASGFMEEWYRVGYEESVDRLATFKSSSTISVGDIVVFPDNSEYEVREIVERQFGDTLYSYEVLLVKVREET